MKNIRIFLSDFFPFLFVKCSMYLNRRVFIMRTSTDDTLNCFVFVFFIF